MKFPWPVVPNLVFFVVKKILIILVFTASIVCLSIKLLFLTNNSLNNFFDALHYQILKKCCFFVFSFELKKWNKDDRILFNKVEVFLTIDVLFLNTSKMLLFWKKKPLESKYSLVTVASFSICWNKKKNLLNK